MATDVIEILSQIKNKLKRMSGLNAAHEIKNEMCSIKAAHLLFIFVFVIAWL